MKKIIALFFFLSPVFAQASDVTVNNFNEVKGEQATRAASNVDLVVGLAIGGSGKQSHKNLMIANPVTKNNVFCLALRSRDGQYSAAADLNIKFVVKDNLDFEVPVTDGKKLAAPYEDSDLPKLIYERNIKFPGCQADKSSHHVPIISSKLALNELNVYINAPNSRVRAQLFVNKGNSETVNDLTDKEKLTENIVCAPLKEGLRVGYSAICKINVPKDKRAEKGYILSISENNQGVEQTRKIKLTLPEQ
jgi:hypothetical protein